ncbi:FAD-dependent oxidoreductase [Clostridium sp. CCUG 7971]|uniref:FAD-dependent oxidoreductase n=1 Tax=Clostridium sp. CCUG 7971 TaxID=2811414 RepID=UPI001ABB90A3|nr:FAD-dependent oxidoreductase [Clostridium sp. CCUG 7971]MBO3446285.1 FAD-dependent oxidoreductase [Clostridium sp. CCUG 7971]
MNQSYWILSTQSKNYEKLGKNIKTNTLIVGAGIVGITTAYLLAKQGVDVVVVDADKVAYGSSGRNTGKVTTQHDVKYSEINNKYGLEIASLYYEGNNEALNLVKDIIKENNIDCKFEQVSAYMYTQNENYIPDLKDEYELCKKIGIDCEYHNKLDLPMDIKGAISFNNQGQFNPKQYVDALANKCVELGVKIYENTPITNLEKGKVCKAKTKDNTEIEAENIVIASHVPWYDGLNLYFAKEKADRSYLLGVTLETDFPKGMFISIEEPTKTFRSYEGEGKKLLIFGGNDHKTGQGKIEEEIFEDLKQYASENFNVNDFKYEWSAQDCMSFDNMPYIGYINKSENNIYVATGFSKWGMTNGTLSAIIISDLITKDKSKYEEIFKPTRKGSYLNTDFIKENLNVGISYISGKLKFGSEEMPREKGEGKIVNIDGKRYGAYRNYDGELYVVDITCTHLGCELKFNSAEKTWDCPCHGSRFNYEGNILEGPALRPLKRYGEGKNKVDPKLY